ncbi:sugar phosphate isomerase/epimerase family protein [Humibacillus xanthopallidus]|uniref:Sugar phosphate isomerase/epimerase n=1 Tax=Humibacillus xanthopallidus TaxID=412689 RepID=A0A543HFV7_9MICO|nr:sugar phosphate isomerase/epimerase family protein [Humibacillus xanthopallidus]TQM57216.1 sugar phosphate isomerase/epimerase [Humibacillus xanthopallidus]
MSLRFGYGLNGFTDHRLSDALAVLADLGYDGVALTLDHAHLDPFAPDLAARTAAVAALLARHELGVVVETGARYVLDPRRKHEPTLVSDDGRERRIDLLHRAIRVAADLGSSAVSFWSGIAPAGAGPGECWARVEEGVESLLPVAESRGVDLALEPEPGMFVERIADVLELRRRLGSPDRLRLTIDVGHLRCTEDADPAACVLGAADLVANVQIDDMRRGVHEHLPFGEGEVDFPPVLAALSAIDFRGLVAVELPRHPHAAPALAAASLDFLRDAERRAQVDRPHRRPQEVAR